MNNIELDMIRVHYGERIQSKTGSREHLTTILNRIARDDKLKETIEIIRNTTNHDQRSQLKRENLPYFVLSTFKGDSRRLDNLENAYGVVLDIDGLNDRLSEVRRKVQDDPFVAFLFTSPSGNGLKVGVLLDRPIHSNDTFKRVWDKVTLYFRGTYGVENDAQTSDSTRAIYLSHDADLMISPGSVGFPTPPPQAATVVKTDHRERPPANQDMGKDEITKAMDAARYLRGRLGDTRKWKQKEWISMCYVICNTFGEDGVRIWMELSLDAKQYNDTEASLRNRYDYCLNRTKTYKGNRITIASLYQLAQKNGWKPSFKQPSGRTSYATTDAPMSDESHSESTRSETVSSPGLLDIAESVKALQVVQDQLVRQVEQLTRKIEEMSQQQQVVPGEYIDIKQLAAMLGVSKSTAYKLSSSGDLTRYKPGGKKVLFKLEEVEDYIKKSGRRSKAEVYQIINSRLEAVEAGDIIKKKAGRQ